MIGSAQVTNSLLRAVFDRGERITLDRLQALLYLLDQRWTAERGEPLIGEPFLASDAGPRISHIEYQYGSLGVDGHIERFCKDAEGHASMAGDEVAEEAAQLVRDSAHMTTAALVISATSPGAAWSRARETPGARFLHEAAR